MPRHKSVEIDIDDYFRIRSDSRQWILERRNVNEDGDLSGWGRRNSYYTTLDQLVTRVGEEKLRQSGATSIHELVVAAAEIRLLLSEKLLPSMEVDL